MLCGMPAVAKLLVVVFCAFVGLFLLLLAIVIMTFDRSAHQTEYPNETDVTQIFLIIGSISHRTHVLFVTGVMAVVGVGFWLVALLIALDRLPQ